MNLSPGKLGPATVRKQLVEFTWDEDFERELLARLIAYRCLPASEGNVIQKLAREREMARNVITHLRALLDTHRPTLIHDSDIADAVDKLRDSAQEGT